MAYIEVDPRQQEQLEHQRRAALATRALLIVLLESVVAGIAILLIAYATDLNIWAILIPVLGVLAVASYFTAWLHFTASKRLPKQRPMSTSAVTTGPLGQPRRIGFCILIFIVTLGFFGLYWVYKTYEEMRRHTGEGLGGSLGLAVSIVLGVVSWFVIPSEVGKMYKLDGREAPLSGWIGLWVLLPIIGAFVWFIKVQGALNYYWASKVGAAPAPSVAPAG